MNRNELERGKVEVELNRPLPGADPDEVDEGMWSDEAMASTFAFAAGSLGFSDVAAEARGGAE